VVSIRLTLLVACLLFPAISSAADGGVFLYLQPFSADARLTFTIASVSAGTASGDEFPLTLRLKAIGVADVRRQRLLASGRLPVGRYDGILLTVSQATLKRDDRDVALTVPDAPVRLHVLFTVASQETPLFRLAFNDQDSVTDGTAFSPVFSVSTPAMPLVDHTGFVTNSGSDTITVFDKSLSQAVAVIATCGGPAGMVLDQLRRRAYVACADDDEIQAIDVAGGTVVQEVRLSPGDQPREIALTPDGATLISVNTGSDSVSFFDALTLARQERTNVESGPHSILVDSAGRRAFVFNTLSSSMSVIDLASRRLAATVSLDSAPVRGQFGGSDDRLYVIHEQSPYLTVLDPRNLTIVTRVRLATSVAAIAVDSVRGLVCLGGGDMATIDFYDADAMLPLYSMRTTAGVSQLLIDRRENRLYMVDPSAGTLVVGNLADRKVLSEIDVDDGAYWVAVMGER